MAIESGWTPVILKRIKIRVAPFVFVCFQLTHRHAALVSPSIMARKRVVLNLRAVREIESLAPTFAERMRRGGKSQLSNALAERFGVDGKTIRDIWNRKSWQQGRKGVHATSTPSAAADAFIDATTATTPSSSAEEAADMGFDFSHQHSSDDTGEFMIADSFLRDAE